MHTRKHRSRASRRRTLTRGASEILVRTAPVVTTLVLAPPVSMAIVQVGRLVASIQGVRVERTAVFP
jgi:hypothetical protein